MPESPRKGNCGWRFRFPCDDRASSRFCLRFLQRTQQEFAVLHARRVTVERARRRTGDDFAIEAEYRRMARAQELVARVVPMIGAAQVGALGPESDHLRIG